VTTEPFEAVPVFVLISFFLNQHAPRLVKSGTTSPLLLVYI